MMMKIKKNCCICNTQFYVEAYRENVAKYCSFKCYGISKKGSIPSNKNRIKRICLNCRKEFEVSPSIVRIGFGKYCSNSCKYQFFRDKPSWNRGIPLSKNQKEKIRLAHLGKHLSDDHKRKISESLKGKIGIWKGKSHSKETKQKMSLAQKGKAHPWNKGKSFFEGKKHNEEAKMKMSQAKIGRSSWNKGKKGTATSKSIKLLITYTRQNGPWNKGKTNIYSEDTLEKMRRAKWIHGKGREPYPDIFNRVLKEKVRKRDHYTCQKCGISEKEHLDKFDKKLCVNHIDFNKKNCNENNLNTLCNKCNLQINFNREYWTIFFRSRLDYSNSNRSLFLVDIETQERNNQRV